MIKSIYSSKLYKASNRKDRIHAAMIAPGNLSLVQQLADSLDEEYQTQANLDKSTSKDNESKEKSSESNVFVDEEINPETDLMKIDDIGSGGGPSHSSHTPSRPDPSGDSEGPEPKSEDESDTSDLMPESPANEKPEKEEPTEASTQILSTTIVKPEEKVNLDVLKGSLNGREDTAGVSRVAEKEEKEIWIYYKDEINLNDIMTNVIEYIANAGFTSLTFNRLARSDNAIVFDIVKQTVSIPDPNKEEK